MTGFESERDIALSAASGLVRLLTNVPTHGQRIDALLSQRADGAGNELRPIQVLEAIHRAIRDVEPVLLVVGDLQWVDPLSYALCEYLLRAACDAGGQLALLVAARAPPAPQSVSRTLCPGPGRGLVPATRAECAELVRGIKTRSIDATGDSTRQGRQSLA